MKYRKKIASIRPRRVEISLIAGDKLKRYQLRVSNLKEEWLDEIDYGHHNWVDIYNGDILRLRQTVDGDVVVIIDKSTGKFLSIRDFRKARRIKADLYKMYRAWKV